MNTHEKPHLRLYCSQPDIGVGVAYSQWNYGVDRQAQDASGSVVFFAALDRRKPHEWTVSEAFHGYSLCALGNKGELSQNLPENAT
jgi:hypothetical protein